MMIDEQATFDALLRFYSALRVWFIDRPNARIALLESEDGANRYTFCISERIGARIYDLKYSLSAYNLQVYSKEAYGDFPMHMASKARIEWQEGLVKGTLNVSSVQEAGEVYVYGLTIDAVYEYIRYGQMNNFTPGRRRG
jgi:hypothetical protein